MNQGDSRICFSAGEEIKKAEPAEGRRFSNMSAGFGPRIDEFLGKWDVPRSGRKWCFFTLDPRSTNGQRKSRQTSPVPESDISFCLSQAPVSPFILEHQRSSKMTLKVYGMGPSPCTGRVIAAIFEKEVDDWELVPVHLLTGEHKKPEFVAKQPFGQVPLLEDGDLTLFESRAINRYIVNKFADQGTDLLGKTVKDKALVEQWLEVEGQNFHPLIHSIAFQLVFSKWRGLETDHAVVAAQVPKLEAVLDVYEARLATSKYLAGDFFSLADLSHIPYLHYLVNVGQFPAPVTSRKHVNAWFQDISSRPAWTKYLALISAP